MQNVPRPEEDGYLSEFLRRSITDCISMIAGYERGAYTHEEQVNFEHWVRFWLVCQFMPDVLAAACGIYDFDGDVINRRMPDFVENVPSAVPINAEFIAEIMRQLPDHERIGAILRGVYAGEGAASVAGGRFRDSLNWTMEINELDE